MPSPIDSVQFTVESASHTLVTSEWDNVPLHSSAYSRLYLPVANQGRLNYRQQTRVVRPGRLYLIQSNQPLQLFPSPGFDHYWIHFTSQVLSGMTLWQLVECPYELPAPEHCSQWFERIVQRYTSSNLAHQTEVQGLLRLLLVSFLEKGRLKHEQTVQDYERFQPVLVHIDANLHRPISLKELAGKAHLHPNYFSNLFCSRFGVPPREYVLQKRMERAQSLLGSGDAPVKSIAAAVGYDDVCYFCRVFRKQIGITPREFRNQAQKWAQTGLSEPR